MQRCVTLLRLTCKCPWYILSAQSVADLTVCGGLDLFRTGGASCRTRTRTRSRGHGAEFAELSSPRVLKATLSPGFLRAETAMRAGPLTLSPRRASTDGEDAAHHETSAFKVVIVFAAVRVPPSSPLLSPRLSFLVSAPPPPPPLAPLWCCRCLDAPPAPLSSYSGLLFPVLPATPCDPALWCLLQC